MNEGNYVMGEDFAFERFGLEFSPTIDPRSWLDSVSKHLGSNPSQFFVGGAIVDASIKDGNLALIVINKTSRNSLFLHIANNYPRDGTNSGKNKPLSTIKQEINYYGAIDFKN